MKNQPSSVFTLHEAKEHFLTQFLNKNQLTNTKSLFNWYIFFNWHRRWQHWRSMSENFLVTCCITVNVKHFWLLSMMRLAHCTPFQFEVVSLGNVNLEVLKIKLTNFNWTKLILSFPFSSLNFVSVSCCPLQLPESGNTSHFRFLSRKLTWR